MHFFMAKTGFPAKCITAPHFEAVHHRSQVYHSPQELHHRSQEVHHSLADLPHRSQEVPHRSTIHTVELVPPTVQGRTFELGVSDLLICAGYFYRQDDPQTGSIMVEIVLGDLSSPYY